MGSFAIPTLGQDGRLAALLDEASSFPSLQTIMVARNGTVIIERAYRGHSSNAPTNIKSASKPIVATLVGIAIEQGILEGIDQAIAPILSADIAANADPRIETVTIGHLLTMQAGLRPTSGAEYGRWVSSENWVRAALNRPFDAAPGGHMLYSTGSTHLLSAILTRTTGQSTLALARGWLASVEGFSIDSWARDPQGIYLGGNEMAMSPRSLLAFGEVFRRGGLNASGGRVISEYWVEQAWMARTRSRYSDDGYGYGWFLRSMAGEDIRYAWGYGGQMLYIVPRLDLSVVMTSDDAPRPTTIADRDNLHALSARIIETVRDL
ncbi:beta-lactamase family protein [Pelagibacterium sp. H642]|nr:serine hydrolase [Pelagibacterium sp. H642]WMT92407.1 beta-lactamase family protein [Pelagibacterium sp. H642]